MGFRKQERQYAVGQVVDDRSFNKHKPTLGVITEVIEDRILWFIRREYRVQEYDFMAGVVYPDNIQNVLKPRQIIPHGRLTLSQEALQEAKQRGIPAEAERVRRDMQAWTSRTPEENAEKIRRWTRDYDPA
jgi:hypothetical protein